MMSNEKKIIDKKPNTTFNPLNAKGKLKSGNQNINKVNKSRIKSQGRGR